MAFFNSFRQCLNRRSFEINVATSIILTLICAFCYALILLLYLTKGLQVRSFMYVGEGSIPPTFIVPLLGIILTGATSALLTRAVEHDVWSTILVRRHGPEVSQHLAADEIHRRSQWSVSPFARLVYALSGQSWLLRFSGMLLFGTAFLNPILLYGVNPSDTIDIKHEHFVPTEPKFVGFVPSYNLIKSRDSASLAVKHCTG